MSNSCGKNAVKKFIRLFHVKNAESPFVSAYEKERRKSLSAAIRTLKKRRGYAESPTQSVFARGNHEPEIIFSLSNIFARANERAADTKTLHKTVTRIFHGA